MRALAVFVITLYQKLISPLLPRTCRFYPSCSEYAKQAIQRYGLVRGGWLALKRLSRCYPGNPGGLDPVPGRICTHPSQKIKVCPGRTEGSPLQARFHLLSEAFWCDRFREKMLHQNASDGDFSRRHS